MNQRSRSSQAVVFAATVSISLLVANAAVAENDTDGNLTTLDALVGSHNGAAAGSLALGFFAITKPAAYTLGVVSQGLDIGLRNTPAYLEAPDSIERRPPAGGCTYDFVEPLQREGWYENMFGYATLARVPTNRCSAFPPRLTTGRSRTGASSRRRCCCTTMASLA